ncbi:tetratricopeptide repeat protein [Planctomycetota bacterium]
MHPFWINLLTELPLDESAQELVHEVSPIYQQGILIVWVAYSCTLSMLAFYTDIAWIRKPFVQIISLTLWCLFMMWFRSTLGPSMGQQFLIMPLALVVGLLFLPYLVWMNAETIIILKEHALSDHQIEIKPTFDNIDRALKMKDYDEALRLSLVQLNLNPDAPDIFLKIAEIHLGKEDYQSALESLEKALPLAEGKNEIKAGIYMRMVDLYWDHLDDIDKAKNTLSKLKDLNLTERSTRFATIRLEAMQKQA